MARSPANLATVDTSGELAADAAQEQTEEQGQGNGKAKGRDNGPKTVYIQIAAGTDKSSILSVHTNTRTLVDAMEQNPGSSYVKQVLPQGEPRGPKKAK